MIEILSLLNLADESKNKGSPAGFYGFMGVAAAITFANLGAAYGTAKSGVGICTMGILKPDKIIKSVISVIMAYMVSPTKDYTYEKGFKHLASGLCCGLSSLGAGYAIGIAGDAAARALGQQD